MENNGKSKSLICVCLREVERLIIRCVCVCVFVLMKNSTNIPVYFAMM